MAKIKRVKARNQYTCSKCGKVIEKGDEYLRGERFRSTPLIRCTSCGIRDWELSSSEYVQGVGKICDEWEETYGIDNIEDIVNDLEDIKDCCESSLENMPEGLQDGDVGTLLQERIDALDDAITNLEDIDISDLKADTLNELDYGTREQLASLLKKDEADVDTANDYDELLENHPDEEAVQELKDAAEEAIRDAVEGAIADLSY